MSRYLDVSCLLSFVEVKPTYVLRREDGGPSLIPSQPFLRGHDFSLPSSFEKVNTGIESSHCERTLRRYHERPKTSF